MNDDHLELEDQTSAMIEEVINEDIRDLRCRQNELEMQDMAIGEKLVMDCNEK